MKKQSFGLDVKFRLPLSLVPEKVAKRRPSRSVTHHQLEKCNIPFNFKLEAAVCVRTIITWAPRNKNSLITTVNQFTRAARGKGKEVGEWGGWERAEGEEGVTLSLERLSIR